ncbi:MAG: DNA replication/repair protein RecF [Clostridia bacterium]|nr:DNA replication/repair protein RecF [Clostridia bacterium]
MRINSLTLKNFRNIENINLSPNKEMNVIFGENAQGKTNLIEGMWLLTGAKSFRGAREDELKKFGCDRALIFAEFESEQIEKSIKIEINDKRRVFLNKKSLKTASKLAGHLNAIVFCPDDLKILSDGPSIRRKFLDTAICQLYPAYIEILKAYNRAVIQRNKVIKEARIYPEIEDMLEVFEKEIAEKGEKIIKYRERYIEILKEISPNIYKGISEGTENLEIEYVKSFKDGSLKENLKLARRADMFSAKTSVGPHRDDLKFKINGCDAKNFGSQGQKRSVALTLKLSEAEIIKKNTGESPICLLDDIMSELDPKRQNYILNHIKGMQTFLSCCDPQNVKNLKEGTKIKIEKGEIVECTSI